MKKRFFHPSCLLLEGSFFKLFVVPFECLHETNEVREVLVIHSSLETLRHEGKTSTLKGFDFAAEQLPIAAVKEAKDQVVGSLGQHPSVESGVIGKGDGIAGIGGIDRLIGIEDRAKKSVLCPIGDGAQIGAVHGLPGRWKVADCAQFVEHGPPPLFVRG
jgi:hypothetical protein